MILEFVKYIEKIEVKKMEPFDRFIDLSYVEELAVQFDDVSKIARKRRQVISELPEQKIKMAFLVNHALKYGMVRMYESLLDSERYEVQIFQSIENVAQWFKVDPELISRSF
jgi:hypothetical protein